ncbi:hypothetical protein CYMTET_54568 [Cymbomonas tetramitiformis]|uniref:Uncharacterized protein n=1 Tax=Cymbomonas tetramitiformis TaxID=36881 RepID=A0AAE0EPF4_9CHLO|nr:hypothetical protein CYMTET_54568 [Cymbomonas tetramitiformis]
MRVPQRRIPTLSAEEAKEREKKAARSKNAKSEQFGGKSLRDLQKWRLVLQANQVKRQMMKNSSYVPKYTAARSGDDKSSGAVKFVQKIEKKPTNGQRIFAELEEQEAHAKEASDVYEADLQTRSRLKAVLDFMELTVAKTITAKLRRSGNRAYLSQDKLNVLLGNDDDYRLPWEKKQRPEPKRWNDPEVIAQNMEKQRKSKAFMNRVRAAMESMGDARERIQLIFAHFCCNGDTSNTTYMSVNNFVKFAKESKLTDILSVTDLELASKRLVAIRDEPLKRAGDRLTNFEFTCLCAGISTCIYDSNEFTFEGAWEEFIQDYMDPIILKVHAGDMERHEGQILRADDIWSVFEGYERALMYIFKFYLNSAEKGVLPASKNPRRPKNGGLGRNGRPEGASDRQRESNPFKTTTDKLFSTEASDFAVKRMREMQALQRPSASGLAKSHFMSPDAQRPTTAPGAMESLQSREEEFDVAIEPPPKAIPELKSQPKRTKLNLSEFQTFANNFGMAKLMSAGNCSRVFFSSCRGGADAESIRQGKTEPGLSFRDWLGCLARMSLVVDFRGIQPESFMGHHEPVGRPEPPVEAIPVVQFEPLEGQKSFLNGSSNMFQRDIERYFPEPEYGQNAGKEPKPFVMQVMSKQTPPWMKAKYNWVTKGNVKQTDSRILGSSVSQTSREYAVEDFMTDREIDDMKIKEGADEEEARQLAYRAYMRMEEQKVMNKRKQKREEIMSQLGVITPRPPLQEAMYQSAMKANMPPYMDLATGSLKMPMKGPVPLAHC